ncbi:hypothetical protein H0H92_003038 [Tricholoma furcatifolium]|nr:hypothetical protein H0H92_003038 [Tricholoma furcatifolium]
MILCNIHGGLWILLDAMEDMGLTVSEFNIKNVDIIVNARFVDDVKPFPIALYDPFKSLWMDEAVQKAWDGMNEGNVPENLAYYFSSLDRLFDPCYEPIEEDIIHCRARTIGVTETKFQFRDHQMLVVDVGGQKSERRKWIHCFQDVTTVLFFASLSGYDQCLVEDADAILFLNKNDLFEKKIHSSDIKEFFPNFRGDPGDAHAGREYFKHQFAQLAQKSERSKDREIYIHVTTATDTALLRVLMAAVEE